MVGQVAADAIDASAVITDAGGETRARANARFVPLGEAQAVDAIGTTPTGADTAFFRTEEFEFPSVQKKQAPTVPAPVWTPTDGPIS